VRSRGFMEMLPESMEALPGLVTLPLWNEASDNVPNPLGV
jgi:hypothetical protein